MHGGFQRAAWTGGGFVQPLYESSIDSRGHVSVRASAEVVVALGSCALVVDCMEAVVAALVEASAVTKLDFVKEVGFDGL